MSSIRGKTPDNYVAQTVEEMSIWEIVVFVVIMAPIFEELVFRKLMIDKLSKYGTSFCVLNSAFIFGLIHANLYQFFYAFGLGALMGYVYCIYGKIQYSIIIHIFINAIGSIIPVVIGGSQSASVVLFKNMYLIIYLLVMLYGGVILFKNFSKLKMYKVGGVLLKPGKALLKSWGFILCIIVFTLDLVLNTL